MFKLSENRFLTWYQSKVRKKNPSLTENSISASLFVSESKELLTVTVQRIFSKEIEDTVDKQDCYRRQEVLLLADVPVVGEEETYC